MVDLLPRMKAMGHDVALCVFDGVRTPFYEELERQIAEALSAPISQIIDAVKETLEHTDPELASDIVDKGIMMTGGGSILANLDTVIRNATGLPVSLAEDQLTCVVRGTGKALDNFEEFRGVLYE